MTMPEVIKIIVAFFVGAGIALIMVLVFALWVLLIEIFERK